MICLDDNESIYLVRKRRGSSQIRQLRFRGRHGYFLVCLATLIGLLAIGVNFLRFGTLAGDQSGATFWLISWIMCVVFMIAHEKHDFDTVNMHKDNVLSILSAIVQIVAVLVGVMILGYSTYRIFEWMIS